MKASENMIEREIAGEHILVPVGEMALRVHGMVNLSESGHLLWQRLSSECSEEDLVDALMGEYEVDRKTAERDVHEFVEKLRTVGILGGE
ncbi:MAG: PqqD family protein [Eubacteriales bacterium]